MVGIVSPLFGRKLITASTCGSGTGSDWPMAFARALVNGRDVGCIGALNEDKARTSQRHRRPLSVSGRLPVSPLDEQLSHRRVSIMVNNCFFTPIRLKRRTLLHKIIVNGSARCYTSYPEYEGGRSDAQHSKSGNRRIRCFSDRSSVWRTPQKWRFD